MAERKSVNKYYPPDWDPSKGSVNKYVGQHPLRDRARKLSQGILVIRFEMPYNIWCDGCGNHIGMGVRYHAEKSKTGNYYSTPIYKFRMKCHLCDNYFEIQTDPQNHDYVILSGARRKEQRWDPKLNEQVVPEDKATQKRLATDQMYKLEHAGDDQLRGQSTLTRLAQLEQLYEGRKDDYLLNKEARNKFRTEKKMLQDEEATNKALLDRLCLPSSTLLAEESSEDKKMAGLLKYSVTEAYDEKQKQRRRAIDQRSFFTSGSKEDTTATLPGKPANGSEMIIKPKLGLIVKHANPFDTSLPGGIKNATPVNLGIRRKSHPVLANKLTADNAVKSYDHLSFTRNHCGLETTDDAHDSDSSSSEQMRTDQQDKSGVKDTVCNSTCNSGNSTSPQDKALNSVVVTYTDSDEDTN